jgi:hypothetical protein
VGTSNRGGHICAMRWAPPVLLFVSLGCDRPPALAPNVPADKPPPATAPASVTHRLTRVQALRAAASVLQVAVDPGERCPPNAAPLGFDAAPDALALTPDFLSTWDTLVTDAISRSFAPAPVILDLDGGEVAA